MQFDKNSAMGKLQELGNTLEQSNKKMEAAQKSGDQKAQVAAAFESLGTLFGGGKRVDPVAIDELKTFVPEQLRRPAEDGQQRRENGDRRPDGVEG